MDGLLISIVKLNQSFSCASTPQTASSSSVPGRVKIPSDLLGGKDRIVFGNIRDIHDFHVRSVLPEIERCVEDPSVLRRLFENKRDLLKKKYGRFCLNKPKSEYIISQHNDKYFAVSAFFKEDAS